MPNKHRSIRAALSLTMCILALARAEGASLYRSGGGEWNTSSRNWGLADGGPYDSAIWSNATPDSAVLQGSGGTLTLGTAISAEALSFTSQGYTIAGNTLTLSGEAALSAAPGISATISSSLAGSADIAVDGGGRLLLSGSNSFTGDIDIHSGELVNTVQANNANPTRSGLGDLTAAGRTVRVRDGAVLTLDNSDTLGSYQYKTPATMLADGGTIQNDDGRFMSIGDIILRNGGTLNTRNGADPAYQAFNLRGTVTVAGDTPCFIATSGSVRNGIHLGGTTIGRTVFDVAATGAGGADLTVTAPLLDEVYNTGGLVKTGAGTLLLAAANSYSAGSHVLAGRLAIEGSIEGDVLVDAGATLWNDGSIAGSVAAYGTVGGGGVFESDLSLQPGATLLLADGAGDPSVGGELHLNGACLLVELAGPEASGTLDLSAGTLRLSNRPTITLDLGGSIDPELYQSFTIFTGLSDWDGEWGEVTLRNPPPDWVSSGKRIRIEPDATGLALTVMPAAASTGEIMISEVMASNGATLSDQDGEYSDWIELRNYGAQAVDLGGWGISDDEDEPFRWTFPAGTIIEAGDYLIVWASGKNRIPGDRVPGILREVWTGISGNELSWLTGDPDYPAKPDSRNVEKYFFEAPSNVGDNYGQRMSATLVPPASGDYVFWIAGDDYSELWLSSDAGEANAELIANVPGSTPARQWENYAAQRSAPVSLEAGEHYHIFALMKEGGGNDNLAVRWQLPDGTIEEPIPASRFLGDIGTELHSNFRISSDGELLGLSRPDGVLVDALPATYIPRDVSRGRQPETPYTWRYYAEATPGAANSAVPAVLPPSVSFSEPHGFKSAPIAVELTASEPGAVIRFPPDAASPARTRRSTAKRSR